MDFSTAVKEVLKAKNLNPSDLARMTNYTPQYIHELLAGNRRWNEDTMNKACQALGIKIAFVEMERRETSETFT